MRALLISVLLSAAAVGCKSEAADHVAPTIDVPTITIDELAAKLVTREYQPVDANANALRKRMGVIPGAVLLSEFDTFSFQELPADKAKPLVFYCANAHCGASHEAAARALTAGYTNVKILPDGIAGWVQAGKQVTSL